MENMKICSLRIQNYRTIIDSGEVNIDSRISVFAGKNESGKTTALKALETFGNDKFVDEDIPNGLSDANPTIIVKYEIDYTQLTDIFLCDIKSKKYYLKIERSKNKYDVISDSFYELCNSYIRKSVSDEYLTIEKEKIESLVDRLKVIIDQEFEYDDIFGSYFINQISYGSKNNVCLFEDILLENKILNEEIPKDSEKYNVCREIENQLKISFPNTANLILKIESLFPKYEYFDSFNDMIPDEIEYNKLNDLEYQKKNKGFLNLLKFLNIGVDKFVSMVSGEIREVNRELKKHAHIFTGYFDSIYKQDNIRISLRRDGDYIIIELYDTNTKDVDTKPSQRSNGFRWFFSFFLMLENQNHNNTILLIDEPGLYLHASAQDDIIKIFENKIDNSIFYTTHSPFLIDTDHMNRIKLIVKEDKGSKIVNKYYASSDSETMTPIITAIGYNVNKAPIGFGNGNNIITEGVSDRYYILAFMHLFNVTDDVSIIPSIGASKTWHLASLCIGWNLKHLVLLDNDKGGNEAKKQFKNLYFEDIDKYVRRTPIENGTIESVFDGNDIKYTWAKNSGVDKLSISKEFYEKVISNQYKIEMFSTKTLDNIEKLLNAINISISK